MKIWYQTYSPTGKVNPAWRNYEEACERYVPTVARPGTVVDVHSVELRAPKMVVSKYIQYLHVAQIIENALRAEREGYDAFVIGGMRDLGYEELREIVDIPVAFIGETSYLTACMLARRFGVILGDQEPLRNAYDVIARHGLTSRCVGGGHLGMSHTEFIAACTERPDEVIGIIGEAARPAICDGAGILVMGFAAINAFLAERNIRDIDGVPILDSQAAVIKAAETMVDLRALGMPKSRKGPLYSVDHEDIVTARKIYGIE